MNRPVRPWTRTITQATTGAVAALLVASWIIGTPATRAADATPPPPFDELSMSRSACYGNCPIYTVVVRGDGHVRYHGENYVRVMGDAEAVLSELQLQALRIELDRADLPRLRDTYASPSDGCPAFWTDAPGVELSLRRGATVKTIHHYLGCMDKAGREVYPAALATLELRIDEIVRTKLWVERVDEPRNGAR